MRALSRRLFRRCPSCLWPHCFGKRSTLNDSFPVACLQPRNSRIDPPVTFSKPFHAALRSENSRTSCTLASLFCVGKTSEGTRERHSIEACSIAIADVRFFLFANLAATTFSRPAVAQDSSAAARPPVARVRPVVNDISAPRLPTRIATWSIWTTPKWRTG